MKNYMFGMHDYVLGCVRACNESQGRKIFCDRFGIDNGGFMYSFIKCFNGDGKQDKQETHIDSITVKDILEEYIDIVDKLDNIEPDSKLNVSSKELGDIIDIFSSVAYDLKMYVANLVSVKDILRQQEDEEN